MYWTTKEGLKIPVKDLTNTHLNKIISMYDGITARLPFLVGETELDTLKRHNPDQADVLQALYDEHDLRNRA